MVSVVDSDSDQPDWKAWLKAAETELETLRPLAQQRAQKLAEREAYLENGKKQLASEPTVFLNH